MSDGGLRRTSRLLTSSSIPASGWRWQPATMGFWHNKNGQAVIESRPAHRDRPGNLVHPTSWGAGAAQRSSLNGPVKFMNLTGQSASNVAAYFLKIFSVTGPHTYAQVVSNILADYFDSINPTATGKSFGFGGNLGTTAITLTAGDAAALGLPTHTTVGAYLTDINALIAGDGGVVPPSLFGVMNDVSDMINQMNDI